MLTVAQGTTTLLFRESLSAQQFTLGQRQPPGQVLRCMARCRHRQPLQDCSVEHGTVSHVLFDRPQRALTPGQSVVFYDHDVCLGGGHH